MHSLLKREEQSLKEWALAHKMHWRQAFFEWVKICKGRASEFELEP